MDAIVRNNTIRSTLETWASQNTGTHNLQGLALFSETLSEAFSCLEADAQIIDLPNRTIVDAKGNQLKQPVGQALVFTKREQVRPRVLFVGHMDTVYEMASPFQTCSLQEGNRLKGPGVCDMKGGLFILLEALKQWEASPEASRIGWQVIINADEEVGSPSSRDILHMAAQHADVGLVFEPPFANGAFVSSRKGSATLTAIAHGVSAHAGRDFKKGKSAITALCRFICQADQLNNESVHINFGQIQGGTAANVVPDLALCRISMRADTDAELQDRISVMETFAASSSTPIEIVAHTYRPPKPFDDETEKLFMQLRSCAEEMNMAISWQPSGGVCDGNFLAAAGLPTIDTLGAVGGDIHTYNEYVELDSIPKRIELTYRLLKRIAKDGKNS